MSTTDEQAGGGTLGTAFTPERKAEFLEQIEQTGKRAMAAASVGVAYSTIGLHLREDPEFHELYEAAMVMYGEQRLWAEAERRAVDGIAEAVYGKVGGKDGEIEVVGEVRKYSDGLLRDLLKAFVPQMQQKMVVEQHLSGSIEFGSEIAKMSPAQRDQLRAMIDGGEADSGTKEAAQDDGAPLPGVREPPAPDQGA